MAWNAEWLNQNAYRAYPFKEDASRTDTSGSVRIPDSLLVDLCMVVPADFDDQIYLDKLTYAGSTLQVSMSLVSAPGVSVAGFTADLATHTANKAYSIVGSDDMADIRGRAVLGDLSDLSEQLIQGEFSFDTGATPFECRAVRPDLRGVRSLRIVKADGTVGEDLFGTVQLLEGLNIRLTYVPAAGLLPHGIRIDSIATELDEACECDSAEVKPDPIRTINGVSGDANGNIIIEPMDECMEITGGTGSVKIDDKCAKPCCGCPELEFITQQLAIMKTSIKNLSDRATVVETAETDFYNNVLSTLK